MKGEREGGRKEGGREESGREEGREVRKGGLQYSPTGHDIINSGSHELLLQLALSQRRQVTSYNEL